MTKCALVTGGSRGIGSAVCKHLAADHDLHVLVNYVGNAQAAQETVDAIVDAGGSAESLQFDVSKKEEVDNALEKWAESNPDHLIEVLVNNAGVTRDNLMVFLEEKDWDTVIDTSLKGMYNATTAVLRKMVRKRYGRIINVVSLSGLKGVPGQTNYSAAKGGMIAATRSLAVELGKRNITVNAVAPGFITTDMTEKIDEAEMVKMIPVNRFGTADEVAHVVSFLASPKTAYITGEVININGGMI